MKRKDLSTSGRENKTGKRAADETLQLGRHIVKPLLANKATAYLWKTKHPLKMSDKLGLRIRQFVAKVCESRPLAALVRMCLVEGEPVRPGPDQMSLLANLTSDDIFCLWRQTEWLFSASYNAFREREALVLLQAMFLRGALLVPDIMPPSWSSTTLLYDCVSHLSHNEVGRLITLREEESPYYNLLLALEKSTDGWLCPENEIGARALADVLPRALTTRFISPQPLPEDLIAAFQLQRDIFTKLTRGPLFARTVSSIAPLSCWKKASGGDSPIEMDIYSRIEVASKSNSIALYRREIELMNVVPSVLANEIAMYCSWQ